MAEMNKINSFKSFTEIRNAEAQNKLREENSTKRKQLAQKFESILDEMGITSYNELDEEQQREFISRILDEHHTDNPNDKYVVKPCDEPGTPWAVWEGDVRVECFKTEEEAKAYAEKQNKEQGLEEGNAFGDAVRKAKEAGEKEFEFEGKTYKVTESSEVSERNAFLGARAKAIEEDREEFEFNGKTYKVTTKSNVSEGNAFGDAVRKAKEAGEKEFEFEGKTYKVEESLVNEATRWQFGIIDKTGKIESNYVHHDGYPSAVVPEIKGMKASKVRQILKDAEMGGMSSLGKFYNDSKGSTTIKGQVKNIKKYLKEVVDDASAEYVYLFDERIGKWVGADTYTDKALKPVDQIEESLVSEAIKVEGKRDAKKVVTQYNKIFNKSLVDFGAMTTESILGCIKYLMSEALHDANFHREAEPTAKMIKGNIRPLEIKMPGLGGHFVKIGPKTIKEILDKYYSDIANAAGWGGIGIVEGTALYLEQIKQEAMGQAALNKFNSMFEGGEVRIDVEARINEAKVLEAAAWEIGKDYPSYGVVVGVTQDGDLCEVSFDTGEKIVFRDSGDKWIQESAVTEGRVKQFEMELNAMIKEIKRGYGWIDPEFVEDTWENMSDSIDFEIVKGEIYKRLIAAGLLAYASDEDEEEAGTYVKSLKELGIKESVITEARFVKDFNRDVLKAKTKEEVLELYPNAQFFIGKSDHFFGELDGNLFFKAYYTKAQKEFEIKSVYSQKGSNYVHLYNESVVTENYEVIYSDGMSQMKKFRNERQALDFMNKEIASNKKLRDIAIYKPGMHSTTQTELVVKFWGEGSYLDNVSKRDKNLAAKKLEESVVTEYRDDKWKVVDSNGNEVAGPDAKHIMVDYAKQKRGWKAIKVKESAVTEAEIKSDEEFKEYAFTVLKKAFGEDFDEVKAGEVVDGILSKSDGDYGAAVGMLTSSLG